MLLEWIWKVLADFELWNVFKTIWRVTDDFELRAVFKKGL
jgi:hypothetical protein